jgi:hypothetical protein
MSVRAASAAGAISLRALARITQRPVDSFAIFVAIAASVIIVVNAVYFQSGSHPAPFFANADSSQVTVDGGTKPPVMPASAAMPTPAPARAIPAAVAPQPVAMRRNDPIADLIGQTPRIMAIQRALSDFGYGQIKPSGILDDATARAIEKFERERNLPVTGQISGRLVSELAAMTGHPLN